MTHSVSSVNETLWQVSYSRAGKCCNVQAAAWKMLLNVCHRVARTLEPKLTPFPVNFPRVAGGWIVQPQSVLPGWMLEWKVMNLDSSLPDLKKFMTAAVPYWQTLGLELKEVAAGRAVFEAEVRPGLLQNGVLHGGVLASITDSACAVAAISMVYPASYATTINLQVTYLKPVTEGRFRAEGRCIKAGKNVLFCEASVFDENETLVCAASSQLLAVPWKG